MRLIDATGFLWSPVVFFCGQFVGLSLLQGNSLPRMIRITVAGITASPSQPFKQHSAQPGLALAFPFDDKNLVQSIRVPVRIFYAQA